MAVSIGLAPPVEALGELLGILYDDAGSVTLNPAFFTEPASTIAGIGERLDCLATLIDNVLGPPLATPPTASGTPVFTDAQWYAIPNPASDTGSDFFIVCSPGSDTSGQFGIGVATTFTNASVTADTYLYIPLVGYDGSTATFLLDASKTTDAPCQLGLTVTGATDFSINDVTFTALDLSANIYLDGQSPSFVLSFANLNGSTDSTFTTLQALLGSSDAQLWIGEVITQGTGWLDLEIAGSGTTVGDVLVNANFLTDDNKTYTLSLSQLTGGGTTIAENLAFAALNVLAALPGPIVTLPGGGIYIVSQTAGADTTQYGLRLAFDVPIQLASNGDGTPSVSAGLALGTWMQGESDTSNWIEEIDQNVSDNPGLSLFVLSNTQNGGNDPSFIAPPLFALTSVGIDLTGGGDAPLVNADGFTLQGVQMRGLVNGSTYGVALQLDGIGFPLGPGFSAAQQGGASTNVVAQNILSTGTPPSGSADASAVNPAFTAKVAYVNGEDPLFQILGPNGVATDPVWFPVQSRLGPVSVEKIGISSSWPQLEILFDGDVSLGALDVYLDQLAINIDLGSITDPSSYSLDLQGLAVSFNAGAVEISGGLIKNVDPTSNIISYDGEALIKFEDLTLAALASYSSLPSGTSLFVFAMLNYPIGGPSFFFVTGLAAGFGYNRALVIPAQNEVQSFPLVAGLADTSILGGDSPTPAQVVASLDKWIPPQLGEYWVAAGVQFTTFEIINSNALLVVEFGNDLVISVLGISTLRQPIQPPNTTTNAYVFAELDLEVVFEPEQGVIEASAVLSPNSYVLTPDAQLTGGFAFFAWFGNNENAGDFVFTIGGYHPAFQIPSHYPQEPRLGINWPVNDNISITGDAYFAITPVAMMAGAGMQITFSAGPLSAWLMAQADAILFWQPFYLIADVAVSVGVSLRVHVWFVDKTISVEIGANLELWGPPVGFNAGIDWYILSFSISYGPPIGSGTSDITWEQFSQTLPSKTQVSGGSSTNGNSAAAAAAAASETATTAAYVTITANDGIKSTATFDGFQIWIVRPRTFQFTVASAIPISSIEVLSDVASNNWTATGQPVGMQGVNGGIAAADYACTQNIAILDITGEVNSATLAGCMAPASTCTVQPATCSYNTPIDMTQWVIAANTANVPQALWTATPVSQGNLPNINTSDPGIPATVGVTMYPAAPTLSCSPEMVIDQVFEDRTINADNQYLLPLSQILTPVSNAPSAPAGGTFADIAQINDTDVVQSRTSVFVALQALGINGWTNEPLPNMAANPGEDFADEPLEGSTVSTN